MGRKGPRVQGVEGSRGKNKNETGDRRLEEKIKERLKVKGIKQKLKAEGKTAISNVKFSVIN